MTGSLITKAPAAIVTASAPPKVNFLFDPETTPAALGRIVADTGTIVLVTNEGNGRLTTTVPRIHVALMGIERAIGLLATTQLALSDIAARCGGDIRQQEQRARCAADTCQCSG